MGMSYAVDISTPLDRIVEGLVMGGAPVVLDAILQLDLTQQDADFTMEVITKLVNSLKVDLGATEMKAFLKDLRKSIK